LRTTKILLILLILQNKYNRHSVKTLHMGVLFIALFILVQTVFAKQSGLWDYSAKLGLNLGGTMPFPIPANINKIESYSLNLFPTLEAEALKWISKEIGISAGIRLDNKGMKTTAKVKEYSMNFEKFEGMFDGTVDTDVNVNYIGLPILVHYVFMKSSFVYAGAYYAYMINGEFKGAAYDGKLRTSDGDVVSIKDPQNYDFSNEFRNYDAGLNLGLSVFPYNEHILFSFDFNYGLMSVFPNDFNGLAYDMQNIYGKLSVGYLF
jgi:hypothetical protein